MLNDDPLVGDYGDGVFDGLLGDWGGWFCPHYIHRIEGRLCLRFGFCGYRHKIFFDNHSVHPGECCGVFGVDTGNGRPKFDWSGYDAPQHVGQAHVVPIFDFASYFAG